MSGALDARAVAGAEAVLDGMTVDNAGWVLEPLADDSKPYVLLCSWVAPPSLVAFGGCTGEESKLGFVF